MLYQHPTKLPAVMFTNFQIYDIAIIPNTCPKHHTSAVTPIDDSNQAAAEDHFSEIQTIIHNSYMPIAAKCLPKSLPIYSLPYLHQFISQTPHLSNLIYHHLP